MGLLERLREGLKRTSKDISKKIDSLLTIFGRIDQELFDELEQILIESDMGVKTSLSLIDQLREHVLVHRVTNPKQIKSILKDKIADLLRNGSKASPDKQNSHDGKEQLSVIIVVGVNGVGKTSTIAKITGKMVKQGKKVILAAADTFRAAAIDQLAVWSERTGVDMIRHNEGSDPAAVVFDAIHAAKSRSADVLICDTAGRLHTRKNLMEELRKIKKVITRELPGSPIETLLVLDATTGQNAITQAMVFNEFVDISGIVLTKLDGTAKGGIIVAIVSELSIPVKFIGIGEGIDDLQEFEPDAFADALLE